ncbi:MAG: lytic murein transglycosylase [Rhodospirillaceae bacterium]|nr:lytic murein transglycosylase [Rhodospirillaceae bacterium]
MSIFTASTSALALLVGLGLAACQQPVPGAAPPPAPTASEATPGAVNADFASWLDGLRKEAARKGISGATLDATLAGLQPIPRVIELDRRQPEFTQTFWRYMNSAVSAGRVRDGTALLAQNRALLADIEKTYGVPGRFLVAFWGLETNYGRTLGGFNVVGALSTLAYDGRRSSFFRSELFDALAIIDRGHIRADKMVGSWAGAMGQTQFMPSTFRKHAVDYSGDGRIDVWGSTADALGSGANYLRDLGWDGARTWGREVRLPANFDAGLASLDSGAGETQKPLPEWAALGIVSADGSPLPRQPLNAALILPAGHRGPAFLVYDNFRAILKWNRSTFYALAVGHLADRIVGQGPLKGARIDDAPLTREQVTTLQSGLSRLGFIDTAPDGVLGSNTRLAVRKFQKAHGMAPDGYADAALVRAVTERAGIATPST